ncbi:MAG: hypothetical protein QF766_03280 [Candidatus Poseidoniia archaeon]|jgi:hypothetical protein|nr:hypothetical protein [Candidatus Poseidoniia archaeon]MDP7136393.1 hypothetical protein [Candidatus Poseidoniia archaeon]MDP7243053.1 hypothetical protein [Candidatus Poseidoniia archaeon]MDP7535786.1 hypothetical protein [Candidatus Poseidoniia archaeon]MDP7590775.1 hypothetical protein [Candidatus Poseidoniia archaeon]|tara:strand:+ start:529 stop:900 length:372 start_codon:yes stop_codon:yes gene_type:complete
MAQDMQRELMWFGGALITFLAFLSYGGTSNSSYDIPIAIGAFVVSWAVISYSVRNFGPGSTSKDDLEKELQWFTAILIIFLAVITLIGTTDNDMPLSYSVYAMAVFGFTLVWVVRSIAIKKFS